MALMLKSLMTIESLACGLDGDFQIMDHLKPYARKLSLQQIDPKLVLGQVRQAVRDAGDLAVKLPEELQSIVSKFRQGKMQIRVHHEHLENLAQTVGRSSNRISFALIIAALLLASSLLVSQEGTILGVVSLQSLGIIGYVVAAVMGMWLLMGIIRSRHL
jgi:ubiquinone biosynthesis protein